MKKAIIAVLMQFVLIVLAKDIALSDSNIRDNSTQTATTSANLTESTTLHLLNDNSTISGIDKNSTENSNVTVTDPPVEPLIPLATEAAQIVNANISTRKPSRLQAAM